MDNPKKAEQVLTQIGTKKKWTEGFAPTNTAFEKLPAGTVEGLLKPEKKDDLKNILGYHTYVGVLYGVLLQDGAEYACSDSYRKAIGRR